MDLKPSSLTSGLLYLCSLLDAVDVIVVFGDDVVAAAVVVVVVVHAAFSPS